VEEKQTGARTCIGALKSSLEDSNRMILGSNIVQTLGTAAIVSASTSNLWWSVQGYYFSTHGCSLVFSFVAGAFKLPFVAAASFRALISKNPAMVLWRQYDSK
jgi:hypothetical protein